MIKQPVESYTYIKDYDEQTFNKIKNLHKEEDLKLRLLKLFNKKSFKNYTSFDISPIEDRYKIGIISKALEYAKIDFDEYIRCSDKDKTIKRVFNQKDADGIWTNVNERWLCMNISLQLKYYTLVFNAISSFIQNSDNLSLCDYGCGSASLSMALNNKFHFKEMDLYDIDNYVGKYVQYSIKANNLTNANWYNIIDEKIDKTYDVVICLDVLEHVENSFELLKKLTKKTKKDGILALKIAFECNSATHLPQAAKNFFIENDGMKYLQDNFMLVKRFQRENIINGIYKKL